MNIMKFYDNISYMHLHYTKFANEVPGLGKLNIFYHLTSDSMKGFTIEMGYAELYFALTALLKKPILDLRTFEGPL